MRPMQEKANPMTQTLEQLSAAATELLPCPFCSDPMQLYGYDLIAHVNSGNCIIGKQAWQASDKNIAAWSHRTGQLVAVADDAIERYRHVKRGTVYEVVGEAELQMNSDNLVDGSQMMVYRGEDGKLWCRHYDEFHDGRFAAMKDTQP